MLSLPEDWDYTLAGLSYINRESIDAIRSAIRELEQAGYIQRSRERDDRGLAPGRGLCDLRAAADPACFRSAFIGLTYMGKSNTGKSHIGNPYAGKSNAIK